MLAKILGCRLVAFKGTDKECKLLNRGCEFFRIWTKIEPEEEHRPNV